MKSLFFNLVSIWMLLTLTPGSCDQPAAQVNGNGKNQVADDRPVTEQIAALPGEGKTVSMARATWDTGWFKAEIFKQLLEELGYSVEGPKTMDNLPFFLAAALGEIDLWVNSWFPSHYSYIEDNRIKGRVEPVGYQVKAGAPRAISLIRNQLRHMGSPISRILKIQKSPKYLTETATAKPT